MKKSEFQSILRETIESAVANVEALVTSNLEQRISEALEKAGVGVRGSKPAKAPKAGKVVKHKVTKASVKAAKKLTQKKRGVPVGTEIAKKPCPACGAPNKNRRFSYLCENHRTPENLAAFKALKERSLASSPEVMDVIEPLMNVGEVTVTEVSSEDDTAADATDAVA